MQILFDVYLPGSNFRMSRVEGLILSGGSVCILDIDYNIIEFNEEQQVFIVRTTTHNEDTTYEELCENTEFLTGEKVLKVLYDMKITIEEL